MPVIAVYDACVLYPAPLRDLLMHLAVAKLVYPRWTDEIHDEWMRNLLANRANLTRERLERTRALMERAVPDGLVRGHEFLSPRLFLPDPDDRHVLAAAIVAGADVIITSNMADFPSEILQGHGLTAVHPDLFVAGLFDNDPQTVAKAVRDQRDSLNNPPATVDSFLQTLLRQGLHRTVERLNGVRDKI